MSRKNSPDFLTFLIRIAIYALVIAVVVIYPIWIVYHIIKGFLENQPVIGWLIIIGLVILFIILPITILLIRHRKKSAIISTYPNSVNKSRVPIPNNVKRQLFRRAHDCCENPNCRNIGCLEFHHINHHNWDNRPENIIVLCPNCHSLADNNTFHENQIINWINYNFD